MKWNRDHLIQTSSFIEGRLRPRAEAWLSRCYPKSSSDQRCDILSQIQIVSINSELFLPLQGGLMTKERECPQWGSTKIDKDNLLALNID